MKTTRRTFIKTSAATAGAAGAPFILPSHIWAADTKPNDRVVMGFIGMGKQNGGLMRGFMGRDTQVVAVCDVDTSRRENAQKKANDYYVSKPEKGTADVKGYNDFRELMARDDIDAVCIATPDHWHAIITLAALNSGKDVYCEKPLTHNIHEAVEVIKAVESNKRVLQTGSMQRSSKEFRIAAELVQNGAIGKVERVECSFGDPGRPCDLPEEEMEPGLDWNFWVGPAAMRPYNSTLSPRGVHNHFPHWRNYKEFGGGMVTDWGAHHLDIAQWGLGKDGSGPVEIRPPAKKGDKRGASLVYDNGITVTHADGFGVHFYGSEGAVRVNRGRFHFNRGEEEYKFTRREDGGSLGRALALAEKAYLSDAKIKLYNSQHGHQQDFLDRMKDRKKPITSEVVGGGTAICCHLMNLGYWHNQVLKWDPVRNKFTGGTGDAKWLTRDYRGPWKV